MAYDAATGTVVLFGGEHVFGVPVSGTWTWNGSTWTKQDPAHHPPPMFAELGSSMAYDTATRTVVLFGGHLSGHHTTNATWTWNGTDWTKQSPPTRPPVEENELLASDPATGNVILLEGYSNGSTWTWDGTNWTESPATSPGVSFSTVMAADPATGNVILVEGYSQSSTWTWNGTDWTESPAPSPPSREQEAMAADPANGTVVLYGGWNPVKEAFRHDTWTWG